MSPEKTPSQDKSSRSPESQVGTRIPVPEFLTSLPPGSEVIIRERPSNPNFNEYQIAQAHKIDGLDDPRSADLTMSPTSVRAGTYIWIGETLINAIFLKDGRRVVGRQKVALLKRKPPSFKLSYRTPDTYYAFDIDE